MALPVNWLVVIRNSLIICAIKNKSQITSTKLQINPKSQYSMTKTLEFCIYINLNDETIGRFRILNFGHWNLFDICDL
jgi:hypothetical protein